MGINFSFLVLSLVAAPYVSIWSFGQLNPDDNWTFVYAVLAMSAWVNFTQLFFRDLVTSVFLEIKKLQEKDAKND